MKEIKKSTIAEDWLKKVEESGYKMSQEQKADYIKNHKESLDGQLEQVKNDLINIYNCLACYINRIIDRFKKG